MKTTQHLATLAAQHGIDLADVIDPAKLAIALTEKGVSTYQAAELCGVARATIFNRRAKKPLQQSNS